MMTNILSRAMPLFAIWCAVIFCQSGRSKNIQQLFSTPRYIAGPDQPRSTAVASFHYSGPALLATSLTPESFTSSAQHHGGFSSSSLLPRAPVLNPLSYKVANNGSEYFPIKLGPLRYTFWPCTSEFGRPAGGRLQRVIDSFLQHYTSGPIMPQSVRCLRAFSCTSFYEQTLRQRALYTQSSSVRISCF